MLFPNKKKYIGIGHNELKNIGKNPISCIPRINVFFFLLSKCTELTKKGIVKTFIMLQMVSIKKCCSFEKNIFIKEF